MSKVPVYGYPCVSDPRDFTPDEECCTPEEIMAWAADVARYDDGSYEFDPSRFCSPDGTGRIVTRTPWGIGVNMVDEELMRDGEDEEGR